MKIVLSFPGREGGPCACTVDRSSPTLSPSPYNRLHTPTTRSKSSPCYREALLKTPYPQAGPFPLSGGHNVPRDQETQLLLSFPGREGGPAEWLVDGSSLHYGLGRVIDCSIPFLIQKGYSCFRLAGVRTPYPLKRVLSPFSPGLGDSCSSSPSRGTQYFCPSLKGKGDRAYARWMGPVYTMGFIVRSTAVSHFPFKKGTPVFDWQVCEPPTRKRVLSPFQGDTRLFLFSTGLGDSSSSSPSRGTQVIVLP